MTTILTKNPRLFPCCICGEPRDVRTTKKGKPYLHCDPCGLQMFVRIEPGIRRFEQLVADAEGNDIWKRLATLQHRYQFTCPKCGKKFWLRPELIKKLPLTLKIEGYRCPEEGCNGLVPHVEAA
jgi:transcription elongation factor Elf1